MSKKVVSLWIAGISIVNFIVGYGFGAVYQKYALFSPIFCFTPSVVTFIVLCILDKIRQKRRDKRGIYGTCLTRVAEDGSYVLDPENLYEAVEKLGWYEHEMKGAESNDL